MRGGLGRGTAGLGQRVHHRQLHREPGLELALLGPDRPHLGPRVALDHDVAAQESRIWPPARRRCARCPRRRRRPARPAASARSASRASRPPATEVLEVSGTPITGRSVCAATTPGQGGREPGAGDDHLEPAQLRVLRVVGHRVRVAVRAHHADLEADAALLELRTGLLHHRHVALRAHHDPDPRRVARRGSSNSVLHLRLRHRSALPRPRIRRLDPLHGARGDVAFASACRRSGSARPPRRRARARRPASAPSPVTFSTRPPAVTICAVHLGRAGVETSASADASRPRDLVARRRGLRDTARGEHHGHGPVAPTTPAPRPRGRPGASAASSSSSRSLRSRGSTAWVSGSPKRQLNSSTRGPSAVSISPA